jgi:hypothetical protein
MGRRLNRNVGIVLLGCLFTGCSDREAAPEASGSEKPKAVYLNYGIGYCLNGDALLDIDGNGSVDAIVDRGGIEDRSKFGADYPRRWQVNFISDKEHEMTREYLFNSHSETPTMSAQMQELADLVYHYQHDLRNQTAKQEIYLYGFVDGRR